ncbi:MAG TPA: carboxypeptidase-like regulatory domain-containing protein, partial [Pyrinomonadaceae bacterium]|nr:carboxypeptidase-like regulatory domain-containing protein [Pyrinomonadaceae bacterium]
MSASINTTSAQFLGLDCRSNFLRRFGFSIVFLLSVLAIFNLSAVAQGPVNGGFAGTVNDVAGNPIPGATVQFINQANGFRTAKRSDSNGKFFQDNLPPGVYQIVVINPGFRRFEKIQELYATRSNTIIPVPVVLESETAAVTPTPTPTPTDTQT